MFALKNGTFRLFRVAGIDVFLHWSWFVVAAWDLSARADRYSSRAWNVAEYLALFAIILLHEFGHSLACRSVGGQADRIVLWPLGGVAFVRPPARPGAVLWSIAAGPLVNVALAAVLVPAYFLRDSWGYLALSDDAQNLFDSITLINGGLLVFNLFPIYPMDGGQIFQALLWFVVGRPWSLIVAGSTGVLFAASGALAALWLNHPWITVVLGFIAWRALAGVKLGLALRKLAAAPRRDGLACPSCHAAPPIGPFWICKDCRTTFDTFEAGGVCPSCSTPFAETGCPSCARRSPFRGWAGKVAPIDDETARIASL